MKLLLRKTMRDMKASWAQSLALIIIVALGIASLVSMAGAYRDLSSSYQRTYDELHFADVSFTVQAAPESVLDEVKSVPGVETAAERLVIDSGYELPNGDPIRSRLIGVPPGQQPPVNALYIREGRFLSQDDRDSVLVESHFADYYDLKVGDQVTPIVQGKKKPLTIVGVVSSPEYLLVSASKQDFLPSPRTFAVLWVSLPELQDWMGMAGQINNINVLVQKDADRDAVISAIEPLLTPYHLTETITAEDVPSHAALQLDLDGFQESAYIMAFLMLFVAAMAVYAMLSRLIWSQRPQIGLMKALGYSDRAVMWHYLTLSLAIAILGSILGILAGIPMGYATTTAYADELGIPLVQSNIHPDLILIGVGMSLAFAVLAAISPARASAHMPPAAAMRVDASQMLANGRRFFLERWYQPPLWLRLPLRDVFRNRRRTLTTMLGVSFSFVLVLIALGMMDSMNVALYRNFHVVETWDAMVWFNAPQTPDTRNKVQDMTGVEKAEPVIQIPATLTALGHEQDAFLVAIQPDDSLHVLQLPEGLTPDEALADGNIVLTSWLVKELELKPGDEVMVSSFMGKSAFTYKTTTDELGGSMAYISYEEAQKRMGAPVEMFNSLYLTIDPAHTTQIKQALYHLPGVSSVQIKADVQKDWETLMGFFYVFVAVILIFALLMAFALLFNSMTINVLEREREFATMRAIGASGWRIARLVLVETVLLWLITLIPGLLLGTWANAAFISTYNGEMFSVPAYISPVSYAITAAGVLIVMLLSTLPAIRRINHLNLAEATKMIT
jgi:putative ABC transport system permease protein